jgi:2-polyprenyl-3-methyl-5-hydroxy-6-metoxy-1,4-benzoquinol methylase
MAQSKNYYSNTRRDIIQYIPANAKVVLEIGCGNGNFGAMLKEKGVAVWGVEYAPGPAAEASAKLNRVLKGDIEEIYGQLPDKTFDAIVCNDVLEHLNDPGALLAHLKAKLTDGGIVVCSIPNVRYFRVLWDYLVNKNWDYTEDGILDRTHKRFFTYKSIQKLFKEQGYCVRSIKGINRTKSLKPVFWNILLLGAVSDTRYLQFVVVAALGECCPAK